MCSISFVEREPQICSIISDGVISLNHPVEKWLYQKTANIHSLQRDRQIKNKE